MRTLVFYCCLFCFSVTAFTQEKLQEINPVLHDQSYVTRFSIRPNETTSEQLRIQTHLSYVEQLLRMTFTAGLTRAQRANRLVALDLLHQYNAAGVFPVNLDYPCERRPCPEIFALGYLIEQTKGRQLAEEINTKHQYDFLLDMNEPAIETWANEFGLTLEECAMIQPAYGPPPASQTTYAEIKTGYGISSGLIGGTNMALTLANLSNRWRQHPALSYAGLIAGAGQVILGVVNIKSSKPNYWMGGEAITSYKKQNNLSYINIAVGASTIVTSALSLAINRKNKDKRNAFNLYSYPDYSNSFAVGFCFTRRM